jgi:hypothetical protein
VTPAALAALRGLASEGTLPLRVAGRCMAPDLQDGATVRIGPARLYVPGDVLAFADRSGRLVLHRLIGYQPVGSRFGLRTQADTEGIPDAAVPLDRVIGKVTGRVAPWRRIRAVGRFLELVASRWLGRP